MAIGEAYLISRDFIQKVLVFKNILYLYEGQSQQSGIFIYQEVGICKMLKG